MKKSCIYKEQLNIKIENYGYQNLFYSYNEDTTFEDLLEYISSLIPGLNICPCFYFTLSSFLIQDKINNTEKIKSNSFNGKKTLILKKNEKNYNCDKKYYK